MATEERGPSERVRKILEKERPTCRWRRTREGEIERAVERGGDPHRSTTEDGCAPNGPDRERGDGVVADPEQLGDAVGQRQLEPPIGVLGDHRAQVGPRAVGLQQAEPPQKTKTPPNGIGIGGSC